MVARNGTDAMNILTRILWKISLGIAVVAVGLALWMRGERYAAQARMSDSLIKRAIAIGNANAEIARSQASLSKTIEAVAAVAAARKQQLRSHSDHVRKAINDAPMDADGPLAPVLRDQLDRLPDASVPDPTGNLAATGNTGSSIATK